MQPNASATTIVFVHKNHPFDPTGVNGGAETAVVKLASALAGRGWDVVVGARLTNGGRAMTLAGVRYEPLGDQYDVESFLQRVDAAGKPFHLIVASEARALIAANRAINVCSRLFITHEPSTEAFGVAPSELSKLADQIICVSELQRQLFIRAGGSEQQSVVIHNGADLEIFTPGEPDQRDFNRLVFAGALVVDKGLHVLIEAFAELTGRFPALTLDVYGSSAMWGREEYLDIKSLARAFPRLTFHGAVSQQTLAEAYRTAGLLVQPSIYFDAFGLSVAEAQVSGLPAIGSARTGMREIISDGVTGVLLDEPTPASVRDAIGELIAHPATLRQMSEACLRTKRSEFSWERTAERVEGLFQPVPHGVQPVSLQDSVELSPAPSHATDIRLSVGIITYNRLSYLKEALQSVLSQTRAADEIIIVNDGSTDETHAFLSSIANPQIRVISGHPNEGRPHARNRVANAVRGDYLVWLDDDDAFEPHALATIENAIRQHPEADILYGDHIQCSAEMQPVGMNRYRSIEPEKLLLHFVYEDVVPNPATAIRRSVFDRVGGYDPAFLRCQDYDFWVRAAVAGCRFVHYGSAVYRFRMHENNSANPVHTEKQSEYQCLILRRMLATTELEKIFTILDWKRDANQAGAEAMQMLAKVFFDHGDDDAALECLDLAEDFFPTQTSRVVRAFVLRAQGKAEEATEAFAQVIAELEPNLRGYLVEPGAPRGSKAVAEEAKNAASSQPSVHASPGVSAIATEPH
ncbi:MAG: glycosyltransferase [Bdellovibrionales bacterium]|nr:glycosyltransferase [Bdellovibrionales bacterium]